MEVAKKQARFPILGRPLSSRCEDRRSGSARSRNCDTNFTNWHELWKQTEMLKTHPKAKAVIGKLPPLAVLQIFLQKVPPPIRSATVVRSPTVMFLRQGMGLWFGTCSLKNCLVKPINKSEILKAESTPEVRGQMTDDRKRNCAMRSAPSGEWQTLTFGKQKTQTPLMLSAR